MSSYQIQEVQQRAPQSLLKAVEQVERKESLWHLAQGVRDLTLSKAATAAPQSAAPDASCHGHHDASGVGDGRHLRGRRLSSYSRVTQPEQMAPELTPAPLRRRVLRELQRCAERVRSLPARLRTKPAPLAQARQPPPLQT